MTKGRGLSTGLQKLVTNTASLERSREALDRLGLSRVVTVLRGAVLGAFLLLLLFLPATVWGQYSYLPFKMLSTSSDPFLYCVDDRSPLPSGLDLASVRTVTTRAWSAWNAVACATPKANGLGLCAVRVPDPQDPYDLFSVTPVWLSNSDDPDFLAILGSPMVAALTLPVAYAGVLRTCDVFLNGVNQPWTVLESVPGDRLDLESVLIHEFGHCLGLDHFGTLSDVMTFSVDVGRARRGLGPNDAQALCQRYPLAGAKGSACLDNGGCSGPTLKCVDQPATPGAPQRLCTSGCALNAGGSHCDVHLSCQPSIAFAPNYDGACLLPGNVVTPIGRPCDRQTGCGTPGSVCLPPVRQSTGTMFWADGYCTQSCELGQAPCPSGSQCVGVGAPRCLRSCRVGMADCRPDYACAGTGVGPGVCVPKCAANADCPDTLNYECRICDGLCVPKNSPSGQIGDLCSTEATCGAGQTCNVVDPAKTVAQCTRQCSRGCATCPAGSSCHPTLYGLFCLKDCSGPGTCPAGLRCGDTPNGRGCLPACETKDDCLVGQICQQGECLSPSQDAGCTVLCEPADGGHPITPSPDGGTRPGGGGAGCGCSTSPALVGLLAVACLLVSRRWRWIRR